MNTVRQAVFDHHKYNPCPVISLPQRRWPDRRIDQAPIWCSEDLRDGNQALINPLTIEQKTAFFELLVRIGFKEIAVGFPSASQTDYDFIRLLIEERLIPDDVTVSVLMPAREALIRRSFEALKGAKSAIMHLYNSTSRVQRELVFKMGRDGITALAVNGARVMKECAAAQPETAWQFQYSPESFTATEPDYALEVCNAVADVWQPTVKRPIIFNLPSTVEISTPNVYADQIEWFSTRIRHREAVIISVHTHNDRGCAVAAAELALMAGAQRVEGTLFGNGERTGNADIMVMAMNMYSQGIDPELDFSNLDAISRQVSQFNQIAVHPRHPYAGDLVFTAFSGSHQDAIKKCLEARRPEQPWNVAYLPIDPADVGRDYQAVIRINSQSGKGGAAYVIEQALGLQLPRWLQIEFSQIVQRRTEEEAGEISAQQLVALFEKTYFTAEATYRLTEFHLDHDRQERISARLVSDSEEITVAGAGNGALNAFVNALERQFGQAIEITDYHEHALSTGSDAKAACYIRLKYNGEAHTGIACHNDIVSASLNAVLRHIR